MIHKVQRVENKLYKDSGDFYIVETFRIPVVRSMLGYILPVERRVFVHCPSYHYQSVFGRTAGIFIYLGMVL